MLPEILFEVGALRSRVRNKRKKEMLRSPETDEITYLELSDVEKVIGELKKLMVIGRRRAVCS